jgi:hypothetical protein
MEDLFAPTTRLRDLYRASRERDDDDDDDSDDEEYNEVRMNRLVELELITGSSAEDTFLHCGLTWSDYYSWARGKVVWISPDVFFNMTEIYTGFHTDYRRFLHVRFEANEEDTSQASKSLHVYARSEAHATIAADILLQFLTTCESHKVELSDYARSDRFPVSGLVFSHFLSQSRNLRVLSMFEFALDTCHCRAIDALTRTDLEIGLVACKPTESGKEILLECIRQNRGPTKLIYCWIDTHLADALRGNKSVTTLAPHRDCSDQDKLYLMQALAENEGLVTLSLNGVPITDEIWIALWQSVAHHPKLEKIILPQYRSPWRDGNTDAQKTLRTQVMVDALRINTVLHTIEPLHSDDFDEDILDNTVYPLLLANKYRPRVGGITEVEGPLRHKLLGRALGSISSNPSLIWMFLSGNANVRFGPTPPE